MNSSYNSSINYDEWVKQDHSFNLGFNINIDEILNLSNQENITLTLYDSLPNIRYVLFKTLIEDYLPKMNRDFFGENFDKTSLWKTKTKSNYNAEWNWSINEDTSWGVSINNDIDMALNVSTNKETSSSQAFVLSYESIANSVVDQISSALEYGFAGKENTHYDSNSSIENWRVINYDYKKAA